MHSIVLVTLCTVSVWFKYKLKSNIYVINSWYNFYGKKCFFLITCDVLLKNIYSTSKLHNLIFFLFQFLMFRYIVM